MDNSGQRGNCRHKADQYKSIHTQWMIPQHQMKDNQAIKFMTILAERDSVIQERNIALSEKKAAMAERDMAILQRDAAIAERNTAIIERDNAITALEYARESGLNINGGANRIPHQHHHNQHLPPPLQPQLANDPYNHSREMHVTAAYPISTATEGVVKTQKVKRPRTETKLQPLPSPKKTPNKSRKSKRGSGGGDEDLNKQGNKKHHNEWKDQDLGLNQVAFDESTMPAPVCSCTGKYQQCYKWGNGGWQSACCTMTLSMYPLPVMPNKRHARVGGRKMSGSAFTKLLSRLAANGHELSVPVDLKDHWSKHGTNRYITIK